MRLHMTPRDKRLAIVAQATADLARGPMTPDEERDFDVARAFEMHRAELRRNPQQVAPELPLAVGG